MSRKALGELCGLSKDIIRKYEGGNRVPSLAALLAIADVFDVSVDYLLGRKNF